MSRQSPDKPSSQSKKPVAELARDMGLMHVTMIGVGAMIGAGIFVLTGLAAGVAGPALILVFALNGLVTGLTAMSYAELGSCFPEAGGGYLWVKEALPQPNGFLSGWISWFAHAVACSLYAVAFGTFSVDLLHLAGVDLSKLVPEVLGPEPYNAAAKLIAVFITLLFAYINFQGAKETGQAESLVTILKIIVIAMFIGFGCVAMFSGKTPEPWPEHFTGFFQRGALGIVMAMGLTFIAFEGYEIIAQCGEEVKDPKRNIPRSIFLSLAIVVPIYILVAFVAIGAVAPEGSQPTWQYLGDKGEMAMIEAAEHFMMGKLGRIIFLIGGLFSTMSALNATIYSSSRVSFAMGRDHNLPLVFARIHSKKRTPHLAVFISGAFIAFMAVVLPIEDIASATDAMFLLLFIFVNLAVINLRKNRPDLDRGFRVPLFPVIPILATFINMVLAVFLFFYRPLGIWVCIGYLLFGISIYYIYSRRKEFVAKAEPIIHAEHPVFDVDPRTFHILVPVANTKTVGQLQRFAIGIAKSYGGDITVLNVIQVPRQLPPSEGRKYLGQARSLLEKAIHAAEEARIPVYSLVKLTHNIPKAVIETCDERKIDLMILGWEGKKSARNRVFGTKLDEIILNSICDIALVCKAPAKDADLKKILIPVSNIRYAILSLKVAEAMIPDKRVQIVLLHATPHDDISEVRKKYETDLMKFSPEITPSRYKILIRKTYRASEAILNEAPDYDLVIMGAPEEGLIRRAFFGDLPTRLAMELDIPFILTKKYHGHVKSWFQKFFGTRKTMLN
ncbi:MAG: amino acid permease [Candidatus Aminicenantes bacterium]|jgi:amino acid transporter/nucleotide-binding universal stress UspA family protein